MILLKIRSSKTPKNANLFAFFGVQQKMIKGNYLFLILA